MKKIFTIILFSMLLSNVFAQKETFDIITYTPPAGWKKEVTENIIKFIITNKMNNTWCQIGIIKSTISKGNIEKDFESEWQELVVNNFKPADAPKLNEVHETDGWKIKDGAVKFKFNSADAMAMLTTISGFDRCASIVVTTNSQDYFKDIDALLKSVEFKKMESAKQPPVTVNNSVDASIIGTWGANASDQSSYRVKNGVMNYITRQYTLNANGTYSFVSKAYDPLMDKILLGKENGKYQISGNNLTIIPEKSVLEAWSKKDGRDEWGKLINTQNITPEKVNYQFTKQYFEGNQKWNLVLQAGKETQRDGPFSGNSTFLNAWYYGPISANNKVIELPNGQQIITDETKAVPVQHTAGKGFAFSTTNFDDGWSSTVQEDWVQVTKGTSKVLIHYPNKEADAYNSVVLDGLKNAWNILVAPKYSTAANFEFKPISGWQTIDFAEADAVEKATGKTVHVVLFKMNYYNGGGKYLEFITPDKRSFEQEFGAYHETSSGWEKMENMANYNKFAVAASDLNGKWTNDFTGMQQYVNAYTGASAGADTHASNEVFEFDADNTYRWSLSVASGFVGNIKFQSVKSNGKISLPNIWQISFSDIEGKPRTYNAHFSCIKGARILWIDDKAYGKSN
jgi:hypothetical protein